jgi:hypothetical protein
MWETSSTAKVEFEAAVVTSGEMLIRPSTLINNMFNGFQAELERRKQETLNVDEVTIVEN